MQFNFSVENNLINRVQMGDLEILFSIEQRACLAQQFEGAEAIFQEAQQKKHPLAKIYLNIAAARSKPPFILNNKIILNKQCFCKEKVRKA